VSPFLSSTSMHDRIHVPRGDGSHVTPRAGLEGPHQGKTVGKGTEGARQPRMFGSELTPELSLSTVDAALSRAQSKPNSVESEPWSTRWRKRHEVCAYPVFGSKGSATVINVRR